MKLSQFIFATGFLLLCSALRADLTITQNVQGAGGIQHITIKVKGDKARVEVNPQITTILDSKTGEVTTLFKDQKSVMHISGENAKAMAEAAKALIKDDVAEQTLPKATGKKETINGYQTEEYVTDSPKFHARYWVATNYPDAQAILKQMLLLQNGAFASLRKGMPDYQNLPGIPLRTEMKISGQETITSTIESLSQTPVADSEFTVPSDYKEMKMPNIFGGKQIPGGPEDGNHP